jgi:hypothetical protein
MTAIVKQKTKKTKPETYKKKQTFGPWKRSLLIDSATAFPPVSDREAGRCLKPKGNGVNPGGGNGGGPGPPSGDQDKQLITSRGGGTSLMQ